MNWYGFELNNGQTIETEADSIMEAIETVEAESGARVQRGRCLTGFDNLAAEGRPLFMLRSERPLDIWRQS